jgi:hypothetical protein
MTLIPAARVAALCLLAAVVLLTAAVRTATPRWPRRRPRPWLLPWVQRCSRTAMRCTGDDGLACEQA